MALTKADYEKVLGKSLTDADFKALTQSRNQDPFVGRTAPGDSAKYDKKQVKAEQGAFLAGEAGESRWEANKTLSPAKPGRMPGESKGAYDARVQAFMVPPPPSVTTKPALAAGVSAVVPATNYYGTTSPAMIPGTGADKVPLDKAGQLLPHVAPTSAGGPIIMGTSQMPMGYGTRYGGNDGDFLGKGAGPVADALLYAPPSAPPVAQPFGMVNREGAAPPPKVDAAGVWWQPPMVHPMSDETAAKAAKKKKAEGG